jgi:hypothetical protein
VLTERPGHELGVFGQVIEVSQGLFGPAELQQGVDYLDVVDEIVALRPERSYQFLADVVGHGPHLPAKQYVTLRAEVIKILQ